MQLPDHITCFRDFGGWTAVIYKQGRQIDRIEGFRSERAARQAALEIFHRSSTQ